MEGGLKTEAGLITSSKMIYSLFPNFQPSTNRQYEIAGTTRYTLNVKTYPLHAGTRARSQVRNSQLTRSQAASLQDTAAAGSCRELQITATLGNACLPSS